MTDREIIDKSKKVNFYRRLGILLKGMINDDSLKDLESKQNIEKAVESCRKNYKPLNIQEIKDYLMRAKTKEEFFKRIVSLKGLEFVESGAVSWLEYYGNEIPKSRKERK